MALYKIEDTNEIPHTFSLCLLAINAVARKKAITDEGDVVVLNDDGTWIYENGKAKGDIELIMNSLTFSKHSDSAFKLKSTKIDAAFWIPPPKKNGHLKK